MNKLNAPQYLQLNKGGTPARLSILKNAAAYTKARDVSMPPSLQLATWREARAWNFRNWSGAYADMSQGSNAAKPVWYSHTGEYFRNEEYADRIDDSPIDHTGWYSNEDCSEKVRGIVGMLSHGRYISGYTWTGNDERVYFGQVFDDIREAARAADHEAQQYAELCREDDAKFQEARRLEEANEDAFTRLRECIVLRNQSCMSYVRDEISELIETIRGNRDRLANEFKNYI